MRPRFFGLCPAALLAALTAAAPGARAENAQKARELFQQGSTFYDLQQFDKAIEVWKQGYQEKLDPSFLYNIAQAYRVTGDAANAIFFYRGYLRNSPKAHNRAEVEQKIAALQKQTIDQEHAKQIPPPGPFGPSNPTPAGASPPPPATSAAPPAPAPQASTRIAGADRPPPAPTVTEIGAAGPTVSPQAVVETAAPGAAGAPPAPPVRLDFSAALGADAWSSGVNAPAQPSFAFVLAAGYTFGSTAARARFRLGALFGYTFLSENNTSTRDTFVSLLVDPGVVFRMGERVELGFDLGLGVLSIGGLQPSSALFKPGEVKSVSGAQGLFEDRLGVSLSYRVLPKLDVFAWPAIANSPQKAHFFDAITRVELLAGAALRI